MSIKEESESGVVYEIGLPPQYMRIDATPEDQAIYSYYAEQLKSIVANPSVTHGIILPKVTDFEGNDLFTFKVHKTVKYKYRETTTVGEVSRVIEADTPEELQMLREGINDKTNNSCN